MAGLTLLRSWPRGHLPKGAMHRHRCKCQRSGERTFFLVRSPEQVPACGFIRSCQQHRPMPEPEADRCGRGIAPLPCCVCCRTKPGTVGSGFRIYPSELGGAKGIRTPDLLHAMGNADVQ
jgi:hypothetical protein